MLDYMRDGGWTMWLMVLTAVFAGIWAYSRPGSATRLLARASVVVLMEGMLGLASGLAAVSKHLADAPEPAKLTLVGMGELAHNGTLAAGLFLVLGTSSLVAEQLRSEAR